MSTKIISSLEIKVTCHNCVSAIDVGTGESMCRKTSKVFTRWEKTELCHLWKPSAADMKLYISRAIENINTHEDIKK